MSVVRLVMPVVENHWMPLDGMEKVSDMDRVLTSLLLDLISCDTPLSLRWQSYASQGICSGSDIIVCLQAVLGDDLDMCHMDQEYF